MTPLKMPEPAYWYHGKAMYTIEALHDLLEQAAQVCEKQDGEHDAIYAAEIRAMKEQL